MNDLLIYKIKDSARMVRYVVTDVVTDAQIGDFLGNHESEDVRLQSDEYIDGSFTADTFLSQELGDHVVFAFAENSQIANLERENFEQSDLIEKLQGENAELRAENEKLRSAVVGKGLFEVKK